MSCVLEGNGCRGEDGYEKKRAQKNTDHLKGLHLNEKIEAEPRRER